MQEPWSKFFWSDYESDESLRVCSLAAQGLWMRMLCLMARATPKGELRIAGEPCSVQDLVRLTSESEETVAALLGELKRRGVYSATRTGVIYSRRMRKDTELSRKRAEIGSKGGRATVGKKSEIVFCSSKTQANVQAKFKPHKPEARIQREEEEPKASDWEAIETACRDAAGLQNHPSPSLLVIGPIAELIRQGFNLELDVLPSIRRQVAGRAPKLNWPYYIPGIIEDRGKRLAIGSAAHASTAADGPVSQANLESAWRWALDQEAKSGVWSSRQVRKAEIPKEFIEQWKSLRSRETAA
jgi:hypothetical protein